MTKTIDGVIKRFRKKFGGLGISVTNPQMAHKDLFLGLENYNEKVEQFIRKEIRGILEGLTFDLMESGNGNFYLNNRNITREEYSFLMKINEKIDRAMK